MENTLELQDEDNNQQDMIQLSIGDKYSLSFNTERITDDTEAMLSIIFKKLQEMAPSLNFKDKEAGTSFSGDLESIMNYMYKAKKKDTEGVPREIRIDSPVFGVKGGQWSELLRQYEFLKADRKGNEAKADDFVNRLFHALCLNFQDVFLKGERREGCSFQDYLEHILEEFQLILMDSQAKEENYFQGRYFQLKADLVQQQNKLAALFKLDEDLSMDQVYKKIRQNYEDTGKKLTEITNTTKELFVMSINTELENELSRLKDRLVEAEEEFIGVGQVQSDNAFKKDDGQFLPFHRVRSKIGWRYPTRNESKNSTSFQTSKCYFSEKVSYDSLDEEEDETPQRTAMRYSSNQPLIPPQDKIRRNMSGMVELKPEDRINELLEENRNQNCTLHDMKGADCYTVELENRKLREILADLGIIAEEYFEKDDDSVKIVNESELNDKVEYLVNLENSFNMLNLKYLKLQDQYKVLKSTGSPSLSDKFKTEPSSINRDMQLESLEEEKQSLYDELVSEKKKNDHLNHLCDEYKSMIDNQKETLNLKEKRVKALTAQTDKLKRMFQEKLLPQIRRYRMEFDQMYMLITTNALTYDLLGYKELVSGKMEYWREQYQSKEQECYSLSSALHTIAEASTEKKYVEQAVVNDKLSKFNHMLSTFNYDRYDRALKSLGNKIGALNNRYLGIIGKYKEKLQRSVSSNEWLAEDLERCKEELISQSEDHRLEIEKMQENYKGVISELNQDQSDKMLNIRELEEQVDNLQNDKTNLTEKHKEEIESLRQEIQYKEELLIERNKLIDELELIKQQGRETVADSDAGDKEKDLNDMKMMNTKLINELDALNKRLSKQKEEKETLEKMIDGFVDQDDNLKELTMQNKLLQNRIEVLESEMYNDDKSVEEETRGRSNQITVNHPRDIISDEEEGSSDKYKFNKTIEEVSEKLEWSEVENSMEFRSRNFSNLNVPDKDSIYRLSKHRNTNKLLGVIRLIVTTHTYTQRKQDEELVKSIPFVTKDAVSVGQGVIETAKPKKIFSKHNIMKSIEALKQSGTSQITEKKKESELMEESAVISPNIREIKQKIVVMKELLDKHYGKMNTLDFEERINNLNEKLQKIDYLVKDSNQQRQISEENGYKAEEIINELEQKLADQQAEYKEKINNLENKVKAQTNSLQTESNDNIKTLQAQIDKLRSEADSDELLKVNLKNELEEATDKNKEYKELIDRVFEIASELARDQVDSDVLMKSEYVDRVMDFVRIKMENYENTMLSLEEEIEMLKQEMYQTALEEDQEEEEHVDDSSPGEPPQEVDLEEEEPIDGENEDNYRTNFTEKQHMVKQAFEELMTNMFTVVTENLDYIANLEDLVVPLKESMRTSRQGKNAEEFSEAEKADTLNVVYEVDKVKTNTINLKEMIECMYDNLMEFLEELQDLQFNNTGELNDHNLMEENKYLHSRMEEMTENYQELNEKYQNMLENGDSQNRDLDIAIEEPGEENNEETNEDDSQDFLQVNHAHHNTQKQGNNEENSSEYFEEQLDGLNFIVSKIYQVIRSEKTDDYKVLKITEILDSQEMR